jgi:Ca2+-transporting ATPase
MLTHGLPGVAFGAEPADPWNMRRPSRSPQESILGGGLVRQIVVAGTLIAVASIAAGLLAPRLEAQVQTCVFVALGAGQLSVAWALRSRVRPRAIRDRSVEVAVVSALVLQLVAVYLPLLNELLRTQPLPARALLVVLAIGAVPGLAVWRRARPRHVSVAAREDAPQR